MSKLVRNNPGASFPTILYYAAEDFSRVSKFDHNRGQSPTTFHHHVSIQLPRATDPDDYQDHRGSQRAAIVAIEP